jgi:hypothetical protein
MRRSRELKLLSVPMTDNEDSVANLRHAEIGGVEASHAYVIVCTPPLVDRPHLASNQLKAITLSRKRQARHILKQERLRKCFL